MTSAGRRSSRPTRSLDARLRPSAKILPEHTRAHNRSLVLQQLFHSGTSSRAAIARATGLTRVTISDLVSVLMAEGLVEELGIIAESRVGKPATRIGMRTESFRVVAIDLVGGLTLRGAVLTLSGAFEHRAEVEIDGRSGDELLELVERMCRSLIASATAPVIGVGVGCPGVVSPTGVVSQSPKVGWEDFALADVLAARLGLPVHVGNDANVATLGEFTFGGAPENGMMTVVLSDGVGAGIMVDGVLVDGAGHAAGEIGHVTVVDAGGALCSCGRHGCLETVVSVPSLRAALAGLPPDEAAQVLSRTGQLLGALLAPVVSSLNLVEVRFVGPRDLFDGPLREAALDTVRRRTMPAISDQVTIEMATMGADVLLAGATALVLSAELGIS